MSSGSWSAGFCPLPEQKLSMKLALPPHPTQILTDWFKKAFLSFFQIQFSSYYPACPHYSLTISWRVLRVFMRVMTFTIRKALCPATLELTPLQTNLLGLGFACEAWSMTRARRNGWCRDSHDVRGLGFQSGNTQWHFTTTSWKVDFRSKFSLLFLTWLSPPLLAQ